MDERTAAPSLEPIAIVGMAARLPGAADLDTYFENLVAGVSAIARLTPDEMQADGVDPALVRRPDYVAAGGIVRDIEWFDASFFGVTPGEAALMDPQQRLCLECAWEAFENAGYAPRAVPGAVGVFVGSALSTYLLHNVARRPDIVARYGGVRVLLATDKDHVATTLAHQLGLTGPAVNVSTACSTSLVAVAFACQSLWTQQVDVALAGGAAVHVPQRRGYVHEPGSIYSPDGVCRPFDRRANGTVGGSGVGLVVLKRAADAIADGDHIYATILGAAVNNDGRTKMAYSAPSVSGQAAVIAEALDVAGVGPETISYVETHGTGTALGDAVEVAALKQAFDADQRAPRSCALGAVKSSIGHLDAAAGVASLIKVALALERRRLLPATYFEAPNPDLHLESSPFYVPTSAAPWTRGDTPLRAGVSSFGMGGTNAHAILEEPPAATSSPPARAWQLLVLSARTPAALERGTRRLADHLPRHPDQDLADVAYTLAVGRHEESLRMWCVARDAAGAASELAAASVPRAQQAAPAPRPAIFLFGGDAAASPTPRPGIAAEEPLFRAALDACADAADRVLGTSVYGAAASDDVRLRRVGLFSYQYALAKTLAGWGAAPDGVAGAGVGALVAACLAGRLDLDEALRQAADAGGTTGEIPNAPQSVLQTKTPVLMAAADACRRAADSVIVEIGSRGAFAEMLPFEATVSTCDDRPPFDDEVPSLLAVLGRLWASGMAVDWRVFYGRERRLRVPLPTYAFERQRYWIDSPAGAEAEARALLQPDAAPASRLAGAVAELREYASVVERELAVRPVESYPGLRAALDALCTSHAYWFLRRYGLPGPGGGETTLDRLGAELGAVPPYGRMIGALVGMLADESLVTVDSAGTVRRASAQEPLRPSGWEDRIRREHPQFGGLVRLLGHCVAAYPRVFADPTAAMDVLYPGGRADLLREALETSTVEHTWTRVASRLVAALLGRVSDLTSRPLRVLEVGAGGGALTFEVAPRLRDAGASVHVTDVSRAFVAYLEEESRRRGLDGLTFGVLDASGDPMAQGYRPGSFDAVIALDVIHVTPDVRATLRYLNMLVAPGGVLAAVETVRADRWTTLIWGLTGGWWHFSDAVRANGPLIDTATWRRLLDELQPAAVHVVEEPADASRPSRMALVVAERPAAIEAADTAALPAKQADIGEWFSVPTWLPLPRREPAGRHVDPGPWLVFLDEIGVGAAVAAALRDRGANVVTVRPATGFACEAPHAYRIRPAHSGDYLSLVAALGADGYLPRRIVDCWSVTGRDSRPALSRAADRQARGLDHLIALMQGLGVHGLHSGLTLTVVASGLCDVSGSDALNPEKAPIVAAVKIVPREYPGVRSAAIDITTPDDPAALARTAELLVAELAREPDPSLLDASAVVLRGSRRWAPTFAPVRLERPAGPPPRLRPDGAYLVVGGLGAIGLALAEVLAEAPGARLVLTARTALPPREEWDSWCEGSGPDDPVARTIERIRAMEAAGAEVLTRAADVADERQMRAIVEEIRARYGALHGVVHAAGKPDLGGVIQRRAPEAMREALAAKVQGTFVLDDVVGEEPLDFFVLCSSMGAILSNLKFGEVGYVAANAFLDAFALERSRRRPGLTVAIDWTDWAEAGMWADARKRLQSRYTTRLDETGAGIDRSFVSAVTGELLEALSTAEGQEAFRRILAHEWPQVVVASQNFATLRDRHARFTPAGHLAFLEAVQLGGSAHERPELAAPYAPPTTPVEERLATVWQELLGIERVGIHDDFFELGGDSLLALRVLNRLHEDFGLDQSLVSLMDMPTVSGLAAHIESMAAGARQEHADAAVEGAGS